ncbi:MAG: DUF938 domain-containing protein [Rhodobacteraceae bacterium]|nr:DUF938 domain-containing protein [Paracoccaceae bacterium]
MRKLPKTASVALPTENGKLHAPSAARNGRAIVDALKPLAPRQGKALEIASGTGEHMVRFGAAFPALQWQPTDIEPARLESIAAWCGEAELMNVKPPVILDASLHGWADAFGGQNLIFLSNLLHLISEEEASNVITESAKALAPGGIFATYGPFLRGEDFASESDREFDESLRAETPEIGYKSFESIQRLQAKAGLAVLAPIAMPANNLLLVAKS